MRCFKWHVYAGKVGTRTEKNGSCLANEKDYAPDKFADWYSTEIHRRVLGGNSFVRKF